MSASPGSYPKGQSTRAAILAAAFAVVEREGPQAASLRVIAREAGVSLAGLVHHFPTRDDLLVEVQRDLADHVAQAYDGLPDADPGEMLAIVMAANAEHPALMELHIMLSMATLRSEDHPAAVYFAERYRMVLDAVTDDVRRRQAEGTARDDLDPAFVASALLAAADGIRFQWLQDRSVDMAAHVLRTWHLLLDG